jgi:hypothetical protein
MEKRRHSVLKVLLLLSLFVVDGVDDDVTGCLLCISKLGTSIGLQFLGLLVWN